MADPAVQGTIVVNGGGIEGFVNRLFDQFEAGMREVARDEQAELEDRLSIPVGRDFAGNVIQRSAPGEAPRLETGELQGNVESAVVRDGPAEITLAVGASKPDKPDVPAELEYGGKNVRPRPFMEPSMYRAGEKVFAMAKRVAEQAQ